MNSTDQGMSTRHTTSHSLRNPVDIVHNPNVVLTSLGGLKIPTHVPMHRGDDDDGKFGAISPMIGKGEDVPDDEENIESPDAVGSREFSTKINQINTSENHQTEKAGKRKISFQVVSSNQLDISPS